MGDTRSVSAPSRWSLAVAIASSTSSARRVGTVSNSGARRSAAGPKSTTSRAARRASAHALLEQPLLLGRGVDRQAGARELTAGDEHHRAARTRAERRGRLRGRRRHSVVDELDVAAASNRRRAELGQSEPAEPGRQRAGGDRDGRRGEHRLHPRPVEPAGAWQLAFDAAGPDDDRASARERAFVDLCAEEKPSRRPGDTAPMSTAAPSSSFTTTTSPADCARAIASLAAR